MQTIHKYLIVRPDTFLEMPTQARILTVQNQNDSITLWTLESTEYPTVSRHIRISGTGWDNNYELSPEKYIDTVQIGPYVWHIFDMGEE